MISTKYYISTQGEEGVRNFKYKGGSDSITYKYFWSPLCNYIVAHWIPKWVAPNVITLIGFTIHVVIHILVMYYSPNLQSEIPTWLCYLMGFGLFTYQILDNLDGKQARATGSASPLGMLFDHGCDAVATWMVALNSFAVLQISSFRASYYSSCFIGLVPFYFGMWSQYHLGALQFGKINAIDEGLIATQSLYFSSAIFGQQIWKQDVGFLGLNLGEAVLLASNTLGFFQMVQFTADSYRAMPFVKFMEALKSQFCTVLLILTFVCVDLFIGEEIISQNFTMFIYAVSFSWSKIIGHIQVSHVTEDKFNQWRFSFLFITSSFIIVSIYYYITNKFLVSFEYLSYLNFLIAFACYAHLVYCVFKHMAEILGIHIFTIGKRNNHHNHKDTKNFVPFTNEKTSGESHLN